MKITKVEIMRIHSKREDWKPIGCRIFTDEGIYGDGEAAMAYGSGATAAFGMIKDLAEMIIGMDPLDNEVIWEKLYKLSFWGQNGGPVFFSGVSALDLALWDIKGKYFGVPVYKLLGGKKRESLRTYASQLQHSWTGERLDAIKAEDFGRYAKQGADAGFDCVKLDFFEEYDQSGRRLDDLREKNGPLSPYYLDMIESRVAAAREAVGPGVDLIMEAHAHTDANAAVQIGNRIAKYNIFFYEEPCTPTPRMYQYVAENMPIPVAGGERIYTRWQYAPYLENGSMRVIQPDLGTCGGITEAKKICDMAYTYDVAVQTHVCASPLATTASLHLECAIPNFVIHEHHYRNLLEMNKELCIHDYQPVNGRYLVPELPGLGNEFSEYALTNCDKVVVE